MEITNIPLEKTVGTSPVEWQPRTGEAHASEARKPGSAARRKQKLKWKGRPGGVVGGVTVRGAGRRLMVAQCMPHRRGKPWPGG